MIEKPPKILEMQPSRRPTPFQLLFLGGTMMFLQPLDISDSFKVALRAEREAWITCVAESDTNTGHVQSVTAHPGSVGQGKKKSNITIRDLKSRNAGWRGGRRTIRVTLTVAMTERQSHSLDVHFRHRRGRFDGFPALEDDGGGELEVSPETWIC